MRAAFEVEPTLSWPTEGRRLADRTRRVENAEPDHAWSSANVSREIEPMGRVAALLLSISKNNQYEGRDPSMIPDALRSGFVADLIGVDIATLAAVLVDLRRRGLIDHCPDGTLRLNDASGLEHLAQ